MNPGKSYLPSSPMDLGASRKQWAETHARYCAARQTTVEPPRSFFDMLCQAEWPDASLGRPTVMLSHSVQLDANRTSRHEPRGRGW